MSIRLIIVDDHPVVRAGLIGILSASPEFIIIAEASNGEQAITLVAQHQPDVILMDLRMPGMDGINAIERIRQNQPDTRILVLTTYDKDPDIMAAIRTGANGYLLKDTPHEELYQAIRAVANGRSVFSPTVAQRVVDHLQNPQSILSEREVDILHHVSQGLTNRGIGKALHISEATVKTHLNHIYTKLEVTDRTSAVMKAIERGILRES